MKAGVDVPAARACAKPDGDRRRRPRPQSDDRPPRPGAQGLIAPGRGATPATATRASTIIHHGATPPPVSRLPPICPVAVTNRSLRPARHSATGLAPALRRRKRLSARPHANFLPAPKRRRRRDLSRCRVALTHSAMPPTVTHMTGSRRRRRACAMLGGVALLCNAVATFVLCASSAADAFASAVICTATGAKSAPADPNSKPQLATDHCPVCTVAQFVLTASVAATATPALPGAGVVGAFANASQPTLHLARGGIRSRAPPAVV